MKYLSGYFTIVLSTLLLGPAAFAQKPTPTPPGDDTNVIRVSTNLIQLDVTVTDKDGNVITDLRPDEFELYENDKKQSITNFSFISSGTETEQTELKVRSQAANASVPVPLPPARMRPEDVRQTIVLVVDDLGLNFSSVDSVRTALKKFVNEQMRPGDLVAIIRTASDTGVQQSFTSDKRQLLTAIEKIRWNPRSRGGLSTFAPIAPGFKEEVTDKGALTPNSENPDGETNPGLFNDQGRDAEKLMERLNAEFVAENFQVGTLGMLSNIIRAMKDMPGRKSMLLFSEGFQLSLQSQQNSEMRTPTKILDAMRLLADIANRSSVVINTLDPRGLENGIMANADDDIYRINNEIKPENISNEPRSVRNQEFVETQQSLRYLAAETGGRSYINRNDLSNGVSKILKEIRGYYLIGYQPDDESFDPKKARFNKFTVKVTRPGVKVRYRSGFFGISDAAFNLPTTSEQKLMKALISPFEGSKINLELYPIYGNDPKNGDFIRALVHIDAKDITFKKHADGSYTANFQIVAMTFGDNGAESERMTKPYVADFDEKYFQKTQRDGFVYEVLMPVKKVGAFQFRLALLDQISGEVGAVSQYIEIPNLKKKKLTLSNLVLNNFTAAEWQKLMAGQSPLPLEKDAFMSSAARQFKHGTVLAYDYVVYNARPSAPLQTQLRLIKDGKVVLEGARQAFDAGGQTDPTRLQGNGAITLGNDLPAGNYILQVILYDPTSTEKVNYTAQFVEFELVD
ncbi:MAG: VWA domain-containing protein [Acidobacteria bacterium]|nr:VWA domain-containing protein [Acidobacteriota bacterium]